MSPVRYELGFYIPDDGIFHSHRRDNLKSYIALTGWTLQRRRKVLAVRYELGFYISEDGFHHLPCTCSVDTSTTLLVGFEVFTAGDYEEFRLLRCYAV
jgi:hypothetical protein